MNSSESYLTASEHQECYDGLVKSYNLDKDFFSSYNVYSLKRSRDDKDKDEGPSAGSDQGLKKRKTSKDAEPTTSPKTKGSSSRSSKGTKSQPKSSGKSVHAKEPEFKVGDTDTPQGQEGNQGNVNDEPMIESAFKRAWFTKPSCPQEPTDLDWNKDKTPQKGPTQNWLMTLVASTSTKCYKALSKKLDWETLKGGDYPFYLSKPLLLIMRGNLQSVPVEYFINNDLKYLQGGILTMTYTTSTTKIKGILHWRDQCKTFYAYVRGIQSRGDVYSTKCILAVTYVSIMRKHEYGYLEEIVVRRADNKLYKFKEGDDVADFAIALQMFTRSLVIQKQLKDLQLGVESYQKQINFSDGTLTRLLSSLKDITKNIDMEYLPKRRWSILEKKRAHCMIKDINKLLKERRMMRSLEKFVGDFSMVVAVSQGQVKANATCSYSIDIYKDIMKAQMEVKVDVKSAFLYGIIEEEVYVCQPPGFEDLHFSNKVYKVQKALYGLHQAPSAWIDAQEVSDEFYEGAYFFLRLVVNTASTQIETNKALLKDEEAEDVDVDVHLYRSMIGSLMYLTASRPDIMFVVCARFQVTPKVSHLHAVKRIFRYLKGQPKLGVWYPRDSPFDLEAFLDSDYARASLERKSITRGCQFLRKRLISRQCKKQTVVANPTTEAKYVAIANCNGQVQQSSMVGFSEMIQ
nr:putative ribonuclease H-like domain-containing protein [Tanacetum cinerariifolium]